MFKILLNYEQEFINLSVELGKYTSILKSNNKCNFKILGTISVLILIGFSANAQIWLNPLTAGRPLATNFLGDKLSSTWYFNYEIGQASWNSSDVGIGQNPDGLTGWNWDAAIWYEDGGYPNKHVRRNIGNFQFTSIGTWYVVGRAKANLGDPWTYTDESTWTNNTSLNTSTSSGACPYFTVNSLSSPTIQTATAFSNTQINLSWTPWNAKNVLIIRSLSSDIASSIPNQGTAYMVGNTLGTGTVVYNGSATSYNDTGVLQGVGYTYFFYSVNNDYYSSGVSVTVNPFSCSWNGSSWSNTIGPDATIEAILEGSFSTSLNGIFTAKKLTVNSGSLIINSGTSITVENEIVNNSSTTSFVVENNANLIQVNSVSNTGNITVNRKSSPLFRLDYTLWSSPLTNTSQYLQSFSPLTQSTRFYNYNSNSDLFASINSPSTTVFTVATGYLIRMPNIWVSFPGTAASWLGSFIGVPNNGSITYTMSTAGKGFNAVGNPYPSSLNIDNFINGNTNISGTLWFWRKTNGTSNLTSYSTCTTAGCTLVNSHSYPNSDYISVGQGFIVKVNSTQTPLYFTNSMRVANDTNQFFKAKAVEKNRIWLNLSNGVAPINQMMVAYMSGATLGIDQGIDGEYINDSPTALNSLINNEEFSIQGRALPFDPIDNVPMSFKTDVAGNYTIAVDHVDGLFLGNQDIILKDNKTGIETDLKVEAYNFSAEVGVDNTRFSLKYQKTLGVNSFDFNTDSIRVYKNKGLIQIKSVKVVIDNVKLFDTAGHLIFEKSKVNANETSIESSKFGDQILLVKIISNDNREVIVKLFN